MRYRALGAWLLAAAAGLALLGKSAPSCVSCCPAPPSGGGPTISNLACCGEGCGERLAAGQERPCVTFARASAVKPHVLPVAMVALPPASPAGDERPPSRFLWLPASARSGTSPLRL